MFMRDNIPTGNDYHCYFITIIIIIIINMLLLHKNNPSEVYNCRGATSKSHELKS